MMGKN
jgi:hypothetical protein